MVSVDIGLRLKAERLRLGVSPPEFASACGVSRTTQFNYEGGARLPDAGYLSLAHSEGVDVQYVVTGVRALDDDRFVTIEPPQAHAFAADSDSASALDEAVGSGGLSVSRWWLSRRGLDPALLRSIEVVGDSMQPRLNDGDKVLVDTSDTEPRSGRAYVLLQGRELLVKYCQLLPEGVLRVSCENPKFATYDIDLLKSEGVSIIGRVRASTSEW